MIKSKLKERLEGLTGRVTRQAGQAQNPCSSHSTSSDGKRKEGLG